VKEAGGKMAYVVSEIEGDFGTLLKDCTISKEIQVALKKTVDPVKKARLETMVRFQFELSGQELAYLQGFKELTVSNPIMLTYVQSPFFCITALHRNQTPLLLVVLANRLKVIHSQKCMLDLQLTPPELSPENLPITSD
jgi:hypothetical protein